LLDALILLRINLAEGSRASEHINVVNLNLGRLVLDGLPRDRDCQLANVSRNDIHGEAEPLQDRLFQPETVELGLAFDASDSSKYEGDIPESTDSCRSCALRFSTYGET
jgi:hypothetical protein